MGSTPFRFKVWIALAIALPVLIAIKLAGINSATDEQAESLVGSSHASIAVSVGEMRLVLADEKQKLQASEKQLAGLRADVILQRQLYNQGEGAKSEVAQAEQAYVAAMKKLLKLRQAVVEADIAIAEAIYGESVERYPTVGRNSQQTRFMKRVGAWSLKEVEGLRRFFSDRFGRSLPITALGQTATHDRFGFDHRHAVDIALHPESHEGKMLIKHLQESGIPFLAFRHAVPGASTGPHIHIGRPSSRIAQR